jgi:hypothetical protein
MNINTNAEPQPVTQLDDQQLVSNPDTQPVAAAQPQPAQQNPTAQTTGYTSNPGTTVASATPATHPLVRHASILHDIAQTLAGGPRYRTIIDPQTGATTRTPIPLDRKDIGMAIAMSALQGGLSGLQAKGPNHDAQAAALGFNATAQARQQADEKQDAQAQADYANQSKALAQKASLMEHSLHMSQMTAALGHDSEADLQKHVDTFGEMRDAQGTPAIPDVSESDLQTKYGGEAGTLGQMATKYLALPSRVVPRLDANGRQMTNEDGVPQYELRWDLFDQTKQMPLSQEFMDKAASYGVPGAIKSDGTSHRIPEGATVSAPAYARMIRQMEAIDVFQRDLDTVAKATNSQPGNAKALVRSGKLSPSAITQYFRDHGAAQNPAEAIAMMKSDPKANSSAPAIIAAFGPDAFTKYANVQAQQAAANKKLGEESTPQGKATLAKTQAETARANAEALKDKNSANPADVDTLSDQLLQPNNLTAMKDIGGRGSQRTEILAEAARKAKARGIPFDIGLINQRTKFLGEYEDPKGRAAINRQAINNILQHAGDLSDLNEANRRSSVKVVNTPINKLKDQFGDQTYTQYQTANGVLKDELSLYFAGGYAPSKDQAAMWDKIQSDTATPAQTESFAKEVVRLAARRANTFNQQFRTNMGYDDPNMITPAAKAAADHLGMGNEVAQFGSGGTLGQRQPRVVPAGAQPILRNGQPVGYILNNQRVNF